ncbi:hypothetical protein Ancab_031146 [Ancistrocladus abbreviatus]
MMIPAHENHSCNLTPPHRHHLPPPPTAGVFAVEMIACHELDDIIAADAPQSLWVGILGYGRPDIVPVGSTANAAAAASTTVVASFHSDCNDRCSCAFGLVAV